MSDDLTDEELEQMLEPYQTSPGSGWFDLPGHDKKLQKTAAMDALRESLSGAEEAAEEEPFGPDDDEADLPPLESDESPDDHGHTADEVTLTVDDPPGDEEWWDGLDDDERAAISDEVWAGVAPQARSGLPPARPAQSVSAAAWRRAQMIRAQRGR